MVTFILIILSSLFLNNDIFIASRKRVNLDGMVRIPAGYFLYGNSKKKIYLYEFYIDKVEMSAKVYHDLMIPSTLAIIGNAEICREWFGIQQELYRASCVKWSKAKKVCEKLGKRLPTDMEWEKAARGTDGRPFPWGHEKPSCEYAVMQDENGVEGCGTGMTLGPCTRPQGNSPYGICDMFGNVCEWVLSKKKEGAGEHVCRGGDATSDVRGMAFLEKTIFSQHRTGVRCVWSRSKHNLRLLPDR